MCELGNRGVGQNRNVCALLAGRATLGELPARLGIATNVIDHREGTDRLTWAQQAAIGVAVGPGVDRIADPGRDRVESASATSAVTLMTSWRRNAWRPKGSGRGTTPALRGPQPIGPGPG